MPRMKFIPELKQRITDDLIKQGVNPDVIERAFESWDAGATPQTFIQAGCFNAFRKVQADVESQDG